MLRKYGPTAPPFIVRFEVLKTWCERSNLSKHETGDPIFGRFKWLMLGSTLTESPREPIGVYPKLKNQQAGCSYHGERFLPAIAALIVSHLCTFLIYQASLNWWLGLGVGLRNHLPMSFFAVSMESHTAGGSSLP